MVSQNQSRPSPTSPPMATPSSSLGLVGATDPESLAILSALDEENPIPDKKTNLWWDQLAFFLNGLINNFTYVVFLSAAEDLVGNELPKATILIADILPSVFVKLVAPYFMHRFPYTLRIVLVVASAVLSLLTVAYAQRLELQLLGVVIASAGSGLGEVTFLALASFYQGDVVSPWSSGTGGAGVLGSLVYLALSTWFKFTPSSTLIMCAVFPLGMLISYFFIQSHPHNEVESMRLNSSHSSYQPLPIPEVNSAQQRPEMLPLIERFKLVRSLIPKYMGPLFLVFWAEYTINQGISPVLLFPLASTPFNALRDHYVYYQFLYQIGVFISRSSGQLYPINRLWLLAFAQLFTLLIFLLQALLILHSNIYITFLGILIEGLFGGAAYANAFRKLRFELPAHQTEFAMGAASVADSFGIGLASFTAYIVEPLLCRYQVDQGVSLCRSIVGS